MCSFSFIRSLLRSVPIDWMLFCYPNPMALLDFHCSPSLTSESPKLSIWDSEVCVKPHFVWAKYQFSFYLKIFKGYEKGLSESTFKDFNEGMFVKFCPYISQWKLLTSMMGREVPHFSFSFVLCIWVPYQCAKALLLLIWSFHLFLCADNHSFLSSWVYCFLLSSEIHVVQNLTGYWMILVHNVC